MKLLAIDCFHIGQRAHTRGKHTLAVDWLREVLRLGSKDETVDIPTVQTVLMNSFREVSDEASVPFLFGPGVSENGGKLLSTIGNGDWRNCTISIYLSSPSRP